MIFLTNLKSSSHRLFLPRKCRSIIVVSTNQLLVETMTKKKDGGDGKLTFTNWDELKEELCYNFRFLRLLHGDLVSAMIRSRKNFQNYLEAKFSSFTVMKKAIFAFFSHFSQNLSISMSQ